MKNTRLAFVHALSPLHAGTGQGAGIIDLPIARERATGLPFLPGSSLKGTLRASCTPQECRQVFGPDVTDLQPDASHASSAQFSDQRLLLLPVRSLAGTFAWVTSPYVLRRFARDIEDAQIAPPETLIPAIQREENCTIASDTSKITVDGSVYLEDLALQEVQATPETRSWGRWIAGRVFPDKPDWQAMLQERFCVVHDDVFSFLIDTATEITARIKLKEEAKTVQDGGLWYEEALPTETILSGVVLATPTKMSGITIAQTFEILDRLTKKKTLQFGGKATVGRGLCRITLTDETGKGA
jgi:CRISPR-associated protein Cmr4